MSKTVNSCTMERVRIAGLVAGCVALICSGVSRVGVAVGQTDPGRWLASGCTVDCGAESTPEGEPQCADFSEPCGQPSDCPGGEDCVGGFCLFEDRVNGGCDAPSPSFTPLACGDEYCGTSGSFCGSNCDCVAPEDVNGDGGVDLLDVMCIVDGFNGDFSECPMEDMDVAPCGGDGLLALGDVLAVLRFIGGDPGCCGWRTLQDADWYAFELTRDSLVTLTLETEFAASMRLIVDAAASADPCAKTGLTAGTGVEACVPFTWSQCLLAGTYYVVITPAEGETVPCGSPYSLEMGCDSCGTLCEAGDGDCCHESGNGTPGCDDVNCCVFATWIRVAVPGCGTLSARPWRGGSAVPARRPPRTSALMPGSYSYPPRRRARRLAPRSMWPRSASTWA